MKKKRKPHIFVFVLNVRKELKKKKSSGHLQMSVVTQQWPCVVFTAPTLRVHVPVFKLWTIASRFTDFFFFLCRPRTFCVIPPTGERPRQLQHEKLGRHHTWKATHEDVLLLRFACVLHLTCSSPKFSTLSFACPTLGDVSRTAKQNRKNKCCGCDIYQRLTMSGRTVGKKKLFLAERKAGRWQRWTRWRHSNCFVPRQ